VLHLFPESKERAQGRQTNDELEERMSVQGFAGNKYIVDINANTGAFISLVAQSTVRRLVVDESSITSTGASNTLQTVIDYKLPNDGSKNGFSTIFRATQASEGPIGGAVLPIVLGNPVGQFGFEGEIIGQLGQPIVGSPGGTMAAATTMIQVRSGTSTGTSVVVTEYN
jgi:hypothetical protein